MLNLIQHLTKPRTYETLKQVQGDRSGLFTRSSNLNYIIFTAPIGEYGINRNSVCDNGEINEHGIPWNIRVR